MISGGADYLVNLWDYRHNSIMIEIREHLGPISYIDFMEEEKADGTLEEQIVSID